MGYGVDTTQASGPKAWFAHHPPPSHRAGVLSTAVLPRVEHRPTRLARVRLLSSLRELRTTQLRSKFIVMNMCGVVEVWVHIPNPLQSNTQRKLMLYFTIMITVRSLSLVGRSLQPAPTKIVAFALDNRAVLIQQCLHWHFFVR